MKHRAVMVAALAVGMSFPMLAGGEPLEQYLPSLSDIMVATQLRHFKLWYAGNLTNWRLANYELGQIKASFQDVMRLYPNSLVANMTTMTQPAEEIRKAIEAKDRAQFVNAFEKLTSACNSCHKAAGLDFIEIRVPLNSPIMTSPFSNQSFPTN
jgi:hypothetical protein